MIRVSTKQFFDRAQSNVTTAREKEVDSAQKAATQKKMISAAQDPPGYQRAENLKDELNQRISYSKSAEVARQSLVTTESIFANIQDHLVRTKELAISASGTLMSETDKIHVLSEVKTLFQSTLQSLNMRYGNRVLLGGSQVTKDSFSASGEFLGDQREVEVEIGRNQRVAMNISAEKSVLGGLHGVNVVDIYQRLAEGLEYNDRYLIEGTLEDLSKAVEQLSLSRSEIAARMGEIDRTVSEHKRQEIEKTGFISDVEDIDATEAFTNLSKDQTALRAAIQTSHKLLTEVPPDLLLKSM